MTTALSSNVRDLKDREELMKDDPQKVNLYSYVKVPVGDLVHWTHPPLEGVIESALIYGRGTADNKDSFDSILL